MTTELKRNNFVVIDNIMETERTLPFVSSIVAFFVLSIVSDRNFIYTIYSFVTYRAIDYKIASVAYWTEAQVIL